MRKLPIALIFSLFTFFASAQELSYYLPDSVSYNPNIPTPKSVIYHEVGEWHVTHDRLVNYMKALAVAAPDRIKLETMGFTYEGRPQVLLIITSPKNHARLEEIRQQHVQLTDPSFNGNLPIDQMPIVVWVGHSIHGNEPSGANASLLSAYYLAAAQGKNIDELLDKVVILFDPSFNPDGLQRFSTWVNQHKSKNLVTDPNSREFNEVWPGGRFNHYWFDLNRDWLPAVHVESQNRLKWFHLWKPNILTDHHEQGSNATFFFQPGVPSRVNPITPEKNQELTGKLAVYHAKFLDRIGSLYFTKENYDDYYYGKGSTYPDVNGAIGILFEQASSRGHAQQTSNGLLKFPFTIRNQFVTTLSTLEGAAALKKEFLQWQREFYKTAISEAATAPVKAFVYSAKKDATKAAIFTEMLKRHQIEVYKTAAEVAGDNGVIPKGEGYIVPANQPQYRLIHGIFDKTLQYKDSLFYDITAWTLPLAFGLNYAELGAAKFSPSLIGDRVEAVTMPSGSVVGGKSNYAYLFEWDELLAPKFLYELQNSGIIVKTATNTFEIPTSAGSRKFAYGTISISVQLQSMSSDQLYKKIEEGAIRNGITVYSVATGNVTSGSDLGSSRMAVVPKPSVAMLVGNSVSATDAGEIWHLLDQRMNIPSTHLDVSSFNRVELGRYNTLIMVSGGYGDINKDKLKAWVQQGGTLIALEEAINWCADNGITTVNFKKAKSPLDSLKNLTYVDREQINGAQQMSGAIFGAAIDQSNPLAYGYQQKVVSLFKANRVYMEKGKNPFAIPFVYTANPLQSGWVSKENYDAVKGCAAVLVSQVGSGRVINIADNPNFRAFWLGGTKLFMNAIFFGRLVNSGGDRGEE
ncbi:MULTISPECIES: M14 metallopeptidase family protein [unclassified Paraflavitalea]|uniref:M14 family metallopeptidase n=1 Tax=unclassified Paraflavitalea TaxID=2798305 RepID=UPI003D33B1F1